MFKNIRRCLDEFENTTKKIDEGRTITREEEDAVWYMNLRLAEALLRDWCGAERVATMILTENAMLEKIEVKFNNPKLPKEFND